LEHGGQVLGGSPFIVFRPAATCPHQLAIAHVMVGIGAGRTSFHLKSRTQDSLFMSWNNMLSHGGSEILLFYVDD
jgi:hypothetical protein